MLGVLKISVKCLVVCYLLLFIHSAVAASKLQVSANGRFLVKSDGTPFVWIGDTMWCWKIEGPSLGGCQDELTLDQEEQYLFERQKQGFNVIQTRIADNDDVLKTDAQRDIDPHWNEVDAWLNNINDHEMYAAVGLGWILNEWNQPSGYNTDNLYRFGRWVGNRYRNLDNIIWLGPNESTWANAPLELHDAILRGLRDGDTGDKLISVHPLCGGRSRDFFSDLDFNLDFNSWQTGRYPEPRKLPVYNRYNKTPGNFSVWGAIADDYQNSQKPVIDLEAWYEHGADDLEGSGRYASAWTVRSRAYYTIFAGAFGHTYGAAEMIEFNKPLETALQNEGALDMPLIRTLLESSDRPFLQLVPDQTLIVGGQSEDYVSHKQSARASDGSYAYVYSGNGSNFSINLNPLGDAGSLIKARWFDPRTGNFNTDNLINPYPRVASQEFNPPGEPGESNDWVLVLEKITTIFPAAPGGLTVR